MAWKGSKNPIVQNVAEFTKLDDLVKDAGDLKSTLLSGLDFFIGWAGQDGGLLILEKLNSESPFFAQINMSEGWETHLSDENDRLNVLLRSQQRGHLDEPDPVEVYPFLLSNGRKGLFVAKSLESSEIEETKITKMASFFSKTIEQFQKPGGNEISSGLDFISKIAASFNDPYNKENTEIEIISGLCHLFHCEAGSLALRDGEQDTFVIKKTLTDGIDWAYQVGIQPGRGLTGVCMESGESFLTNDPESNSLFQKEFDTIPNLSARNMLIVPLKNEKYVAGILQLQNKKRGDFTIDDLSSLELLANTLVRLIENLRTTQELRIVNAHLEASRWELARSRNTLRSLFDNIPDSLYIIDSKYRMIAINLARAKRANCEPRTVINSLCYKALYNRDQPCDNCLVGETFFDKRITHRTERIWENVESPQEWDVSVYPILDESDQVVQVILFEQDLTDKRNMDAILAQSEKMAAVGQLAAGIAHEINNPLTVILANAQLLQRDLTGNLDALEAVDLIFKAGTRALQVVRNLLNFARKEQFDLKATDINATIQHALEMLRHETLERDAEIIFEPAEHLPLIKASPDNMQGVWLNILLNAMDSIGEAKAKIRISTSQTGSEIRVVISDNGLGISPENLKRIFDPFFTTKGAGRGTGLGLSICHRVIKQHGGHIMVDSLKDQGTTFTIVLPVY